MNRNIPLKAKNIFFSMLLLGSLFGGAGAARSEEAKLYIADNFDGYNFSPLWTEAYFKTDIYQQSNQPTFVDFEGHGGVVHYYIPAGVDEVTPAQMRLEGDGNFSEVTGQPNIHELYIEWSEYFPADHDFADIGQKLVRFTYWKEGEGRGAEVNLAVLNDNHRLQLSIIHPQGNLDGSHLDWYIDAPGIPVGRWVRFGVWIKLNTPGQADGFAHVFQDGQQIISQTGMSLRGNDARGWNAMWVGGNHSNMSRPTTKASSRYIDDVAWYSTKPASGSAAPAPVRQTPAPAAQTPAVYGPEAPAPEPAARLERSEEPVRSLKDFDNDGRADYAVFRPSTGTWFVQPSSGGGEPITRQWGLPGDKPLRGDYDGDGMLDLAVWRPADGTWYICSSSTSYDCGQARTEQFGLPGDYALSGDIDADGRSDLIVWRPESGQWYYRRSSDGSDGSEQWGLPGDVPSVADFNGDGYSDLSIYRNTTGQWFRKSLNAEAGLSEQPLQWGLPGDHPLPADYDGDGKADAAVWRPADGTWYVCPSRKGAQETECTGGAALQFGLPGDKPIVGSFDGSGAASLAVWRPGSGSWFSAGADSAEIATQQWGLDGDIPVGIGTVDLGR